jgi:hypothetical protein
VLGMTASRSTLLRLVMALPGPPPGPVRVLGVDDFAFRRGHVYGTLLVDMSTGRPVDLLPDREAATLAAWLRAHPGIQVICRDRAGAYAEGARSGAPGAIQVADRWHLWHNLAAHAETEAARHRGCLAAPAASPPPGPPPAPAPAGPHLARRTRQRHAHIHALLAQGATITAISRELHLTRVTVRRYARARDVTELLTYALDGKPGPLDAFKPYLHARLEAGQRTMTVLHAEITAMGYHGSYATVRTYLTPRRALTPPRPGPPLPPQPPPDTPALPRARQLTSWIMRHPARLSTTTPASSLTPAPAAPTSTPSPPASANSPSSSPAATATASTTGSPPSTPPTCPPCTPSPAACTATTTPSATASPCPGTQDPSKATSTASKCSNGKRTDAPASPSSASASCSPDSNRNQHEIWARPSSMRKSA